MVLLSIVQGTWPLDGFSQPLSASSHPVPPAHGHSHHAPGQTYYGLGPAWYALIFGLVSGLSLPLGSWLGVMFSPVSNRACGQMMAFGAGALLFAVTVELYGHALKEVAAGNAGMVEMFTTIFGAFVGAAFYLIINKWLEEYLCHDVSHDGLTPQLTGRDAVDEEAAQVIVATLENTTGPQRMTSPTGERLVSGESTITASPRPPTSPTGERMVSGQSTTTLERLTSRTFVESERQQNLVTQISKQITLMQKGGLERLRARDKAMQAFHDPKDVQKAKSLAFSLVLGLLVDGVPEGILLGFLSAEGHLTPVLVISLFIANFPEAFSSASLLVQARMSTSKIVGMWLALMTLVGCLAGLSCWLLLLSFPEFSHGGLQSSALPLPVKMGIALTEGVTGGAMMACISAVMLPEAFERVGKGGPFYANSGFLCASGFLLSVSLKALWP